MTFTVISNSFKDGDYLPSRQIAVRSSYGPFKLSIENQLCQRSRCFLSLHFLFKDLTQYQQ